MAKRHPLYTVWLQMRHRCMSPKNKAFPYYGGRGIKVCERWQNFPAFVQDMGERPEGFTVERIDNDGNYEPKNCRWASRRDQMRNRRNTLTVSMEGVTYNVSVLAEISGLKSDTIVERAKKVTTLQELIDPKHRVFLEGLTMTNNRRESTHCRKWHEYTKENTYWTPAGYRQCRHCHRIQNWKSRGKL